MGQIIFIALYTLAAMGLVIVGYGTGKYEALEEMEDEIERLNKEKEEIISSNIIRSNNRRDKRIDFDLCADQPIRWDIEPPLFLREHITRE